jgi:hypothetical protein
VFQILSSQRFPLQVSNENDFLPYYRYEHRATLGWNTREFMVFVDHLMQSSHIEEITGGHLEKIDDEELFKALQHFAFERDFMEVAAPFIRKLE